MASRMNSINDLMINGLTYALDFENKVSAECKQGQGICPASTAGI